MLSYPKFVAFVNQVFALTLRKTRLENLQLLAYGLLRGQSCFLSRIARFFPLPTEHNDRLRRPWRFLRNPGFIPEQVHPQLIQALTLRWPKALPLPLALDWTSVRGYELLVASVPWRGRALPLWIYACQGKWQGMKTSRNHLEEALVLALLGLFGLPAGFRRAVLGRGKGSWLALQLLEQAKPPELIRALKQAANAGGLL